MAAQPCAWKHLYFCTFCYQVSLTPRFSAVFSGAMHFNRFSGFDTTGKPLKAVRSL
jgi:hypothetical protein